MSSVGSIGGAGVGAAGAPRTTAGDDTPAIIAAKQARSDAQARVDADRRAHSPGCVAVDEKGVAQAQAELAAATAQVASAQPAPAGGPQLSIQV